MTVNEPGVLARRQMALTHPNAADWPRWLRTWWGLIQPPPLLLRIAAFPTLTRLPSPDLFPALSLDVLGRLSTFLTSSLPFLDQGGHAEPATATPRFDYRLRRPRTQTPLQNTQVDWGALPRADIVHEQTIGSIQSHAAETLPGSEPETNGPVDSLAIHAAAGAEPAQHEPASEPELTPFEATDHWQASQTEPAHVTSLDESVYHAEEWREAWSAINAPAHLPQTVGLLAAPIGLALRPALLSRSAVAARDIAAPPPGAGPDVTSQFGPVLAPPQNLAGQSLSGLENESVPSIHTDVHLPGLSTQPMLRMPVAPARVTGISRGSEPARWEGLAAESGPLLGELAGETAPEENRSHSSFSLLQAGQILAQSLTSQPHPVLGEVLHRQELALDTLSLVSHRPSNLASIPALDIALESDLAPVPAQQRVDDLVSNFPVQFEPLHRVANLPSLALRTLNFAEPAGSQVDAMQPRTHEGEASELRAVATDEVQSQDGSAHDLSGQVRRESLQPRNIAQAPDRLQLNSLTNLSGSMLSLPNPLETVASAFDLPSLQVQRHLTPFGANTVTPSFVSPQVPLHDETVSDYLTPAKDVQHRRALSIEHETHAQASGTQPATALSELEHSIFPGARLNLGRLPALPLSTLASEFAPADHPLALRRLPQIASRLLDTSEHATQLPEHLLPQNIAQQTLPVPHMDVRREAQAGGALLHSQSNTSGITSGDWWEQITGQPFDHRMPATQNPGETFDESAPSDGQPAPVWQGSGAAPEAPFGGEADVDLLARQVFALLQSQLRAERDRHQLYDR